MLFGNNEAEELRIRYKYRRLIVNGEVTIPYSDAVRLIGPDSAYRLYGSQKTSDRKKVKITKKDDL